MCMQVKLSQIPNRALNRNDHLDQLFVARGLSSVYIKNM